MHDSLQHRLTALAADVEGAVRLAPAPRVRARGDRRRTAYATATVAALSLVTVGAVGVAANAGRVGTPGGPTPTPSGAIPAGLKLPHEGKAGWQRNDDRNVAAIFKGCGSTGDPTRAGRTDARTLSGLGSPPLTTQQLLMFESERAARAALDALTKHDGQYCPDRRPFPVSTDTPEATVVPMGGKPPIGLVLSIGNMLYLVNGGVSNSDGVEYPMFSMEKDVYEFSQELCAKLNLCKAGGPILPSPKPTAS